MGTVTYKNQPAIEKTKAHVPLVGDSHIYRVHKKLWNDNIEYILQSLFIGKTLHVCCGKSLIGDVRLDADELNAPDIVCDASNMRDYVEDDQFDTVLCDPPYNGKFQWNHDLLSELARIASKRIIFQHWFIPAKPNGLYKKAQEKFALSDVMVWQPKTYFGRAQIISVFDKVELHKDDINSSDPLVDLLSVAASLMLDNPSSFAEDWCFSKSTPNRDRRMILQSCAAQGERQRLAAVKLKAIYDSLKSSLTLNSEPSVQVSDTEAK